jgi:putative transposase
MRIFGQNSQVFERIPVFGQETCATLDVYIRSGHNAADHVHLLVSVLPKISVSDLMQRIKDRSSRKMLEEFGELNRQFWGRHLWARGYFAAGSGNVTDEIIKQYIESQAQKSPSTENDGFCISELQATFSRFPSHRLSAGGS